MDDLSARIAAEQEDQIRREAVALARRRAADARDEAALSNAFTSRPDRIALWAFLMALAVTIAAAASAQGAASGGIGTDPSESGEMVRQEATWYGPGLYGNGVACGGTLKRSTVGVAHKKLPCGTKVTFAYKGRSLTTKVIDRGPYVKGVRWDLTEAAAEKLNFEDVGRDVMRVAVPSK